MTTAEKIADGARRAARVLASTPTDVKNNVLCDLADLLIESRGQVNAANTQDMENARRDGLAEAKLRRLEISDAVATQMAEGARQVARLDDPVGAVVREYDTESGLHVQKVRCPLGVIMMIYESRPNVTVDAFSLCFKAGNACLLKGGREALNSNEALLSLAREALRRNGLPIDAVALIPPSDREQLRHLLTLSDKIDLVIPRGGASLIEFVHEHSRIPTVQHFHGVCHIYVDEYADLEQALEICITAKTSAPATCNAAECILVHRSVADRFVPGLVQRYADTGVEVRGDARVCQFAAASAPAQESDWGAEFLDMIVAVKVVEDAQAAIGHIKRYGSNHTDAIVSQDTQRVDDFIRQVDSSCVLANASTRFNDGFQLGLGAEIGISTSRIHAYGPMGLEELTTQRYVVRGEGQTR